MIIHALYGAFYVEFDELTPENVIRMRKSTYEALTAAPSETEDPPSVPTEEGIDEAPCEDAEELNDHGE